MKFSKDLAGALVVPILFVAYAIHAIWELNSGNFREVTLIYTYALAVPIFVLAAIVVFRAIFKGDKPSDIGGDTETERATIVWEGRGKRLIYVIGATFALVITMPWVGYVFGFFGYIAFVMWVMGVRDIKPILIISIIMSLIVHFLFADILDQDLPQGVLEPFFEWLEGD